MDSDFLKGSLVRLAVEDAEKLSRAISRWSLDSEYARLLSSDPNRAYSEKATKDWIEKNLQNDDLHTISFVIKTLEDDRIIGGIDLNDISYTNGDAWVGIFIGEPGDWGKGYGTDAMKILLRYAFCELNLHRLTLSVFEYNPRAIRSYEKAGFKLEGWERQFLHREGRRWDIAIMGILRSEWQDQ
jgi:RimJ/RimL family protein N-acetyltransferase